MPMNQSGGNMYSFVTHTWNPIRGCEHNCKYCYVKSIYNYNMKPRFVEKELSTSLGAHNFIFVGSTTDMFGKFIPDEWIKKVLKYCSEWKYNKFLFQTKNPRRILDFEKYLPDDCIIATTIETNKHIKGISNAPKTINRYEVMKILSRRHDVMISIEPIMKIHLPTMIRWMKEIDPVLITIGADSKKHGLPEPSSREIIDLIEALKKITEVKLKKNLKRLIKWECEDCGSISKPYHKLGCTMGDIGWRMKR